MSWFKWFMWVAGGCIIAAGVVLIVLSYELSRHGISNADFHYSEDKVAISLDRFGIPTISAGSWDDVFEAQGFVVAAERMWQLELMRRGAFGQLAAVFGPTALPHDREQTRQGWQRLAMQAVDQLPADERSACESYARGINRYIAEYPTQLGIEFRLLRLRPQPWQCRDTLAIMLLMSQQLSASAAVELEQYRWRRHLPRAWQSFLFEAAHPWNTPFFGDVSELEPPPDELFVPRRPLSKQEATKSWATPALDFYGSNSWVFRDQQGAALLANDPHLGQSVPQLWYAMRLRLSDEKWVIGVAIPGIPGIVLGMNPWLAWAFTNVGEDVDDMLEITIDDSGQNYLDRVDADGKHHWRPMRIEHHEIEVRGQNAQSALLRFVDNHPVIEVDDLPGRTFVRRWLLHEPQTLRLPTLALNQAQTWTQLNQALDNMAAPAQNVLFADRRGNIGYRVSGRGIRRSISGRKPQPWQKMQWSIEDPDERRRMHYEVSGDFNASFLATANQRIWVDEFGHRWAPDDRHRRISELLSQKNDYQVDDFVEMQLDTVSIKHRRFATWLQQHALPRHEINEWSSWDGDIANNELLFQEVDYLWTLKLNVLIGRVAHQFIPEPTSRETRFRSDAWESWMVFLLENEIHYEAFGLTGIELAHFLLDARHSWRTRQDGITYSTRNRWQAQHPFVGTMPLARWLFGVREIPQMGHRNVVKVERPRFGATVRMVWDLKDTENSVWSFPVGQSGHVGSRHFRDFQALWMQDKVIPIFTKEKEWLTR